MLHTRATGFGPATFDLTGQHVNHYTTPPIDAYHTTSGPFRQAKLVFRGTFPSVQINVMF